MDSHSISLIITLFMVFISAIVGGVIAQKLKQPALLGYIASGVIFGSLFNPSIDHDFLQRIADVGVALLLFTIGIEFSFHRLRKVLKVVAWATILQIAITIFVSLILFQALGFGFISSVYIAVATALSSTAIVVKVLSQKGELETVHGELAMGWLVVQDLSVIPLMIILPALLSIQSGQSVELSTIVSTVGMSILESVIALVAIVFLGRKGMSTILNVAARGTNKEILLLSTIGVVFLSAIITFSLGLSAAIGAFIAGLLISETSQNHAIFSEVRPLRDLFAVIFFVSIGMALPLSYIVKSFPMLLGISLVLMILKWFLGFGLTRYLGNHRKTAFLVALAITQMSEFGFILAREGVSTGALSNDTYTFLVALTFTTMFIGTAVFAQGNSVYYWFYKTLGKYLPKLFPLKHDLVHEKEELQFSNHIVICGYGRVGKYIGRALEMAKIPYVVVDYNQATVSQLRLKGVQVVYGDPADKDVLDYAQVDYAKAVIIAIPDRHTQELIISNAQTLNRHIKIICRTHHEEDQNYLKSLGVQILVQPEFEAALSVINKLLPEFGVSPDDISGKISRLKIEHGLG